METKRPRVLVVDDEESVRHILRTVLERQGCDVCEAGSAEEALQLLPQASPAVAIVDILLPGKSGLALLDEITSRRPDCRVIVITGDSSPQTAGQVARLGASGFLEKPFESLEKIWATVQGALAMSAEPLLRT